MTTISSSTAAAVQVTPSRPIAIERGNEVTVFRRGTPTAEQTALVAKQKAAAAEMEAGFAKQVREAAKLRPEILEISPPNIPARSFENATKAAGITQVNIGHREDKDFNDTAVSRATAGQATGPSQANTTAALAYRLMQGLAGNDGKA